ncbi:MAG: site-specific DNA-methyltransferase [Chitinophagales bacterium]|jgi:DNA modification methylase|nr:site-specific DNA-methyltransferase [Chitinophagales bacterium]HNL06940.1 DNA methyltransferase [Chitinophagales bacterium]
MFETTTIDKSWSFLECTIKDTSYITHGYYTYPAKFIPQLAKRLINEHSTKGNVVIDPFMGSGTTIVESLVEQRIGIGTDINEIAYLIAKTKTTPIKSIELLTVFMHLEQELHKRILQMREHYIIKAYDKLKLHERVDYWHKSTQKEDLAILLYTIIEIENPAIKNFFLVAFAQILKTCSIWMQKSVKPTRDMQKKEYHVLSTFVQQIKKMLKKNDAFYKMLPKSTVQNIDEYRTVVCQDARLLPCQNEKAQLIVTSPPYVTSYEYADLHQLPLYWLGHLEELAVFRKKFIGSAYTDRPITNLNSPIAQQIVQQLGNNKKGREVHNYFADMYEVFVEMYRVLEHQAKACIVIGNTNFKGIEIQNAQVFVEQLQHIGFKTYNIVQREIPSKMLPSTRDSNTGQFTKTTDANLILAYPTEYILIMQKQ